MSIEGGKQMTIQEIMTFAHEGVIGLVIILAGLIRIPRIDVNLWTLIARSFGKAINKDVNDNLTKINKDLSERIEAIDLNSQERMDKIDKDLENHIKRTEEERARRARQRILHFCDEILLELGHSKEHYDEILEDIDKYEDYCSKHPEFENNKAVLAIDTITHAYQECKDEHSFLEYKKK